MALSVSLAPTAVTRVRGKWIARTGAATVGRSGGRAVWPPAASRRKILNRPVSAKISPKTNVSPSQAAFVFSKPEKVAAFLVSVVHFRHVLGAPEAVPWKPPPSAKGECSITKIATSSRSHRTAKRISKLVITAVEIASGAPAMASSVIIMTSLLRVVMERIARDAMTIHQIALRSAVISALTMEMTLENAYQRFAGGSSAVKVFSAAPMSV